MSDVLSQGDAARLVGVSSKTLQRALASGQLAGVRVGREWRIERTELDRWRANRDERHQDHVGGSSYAKIGQETGQETPDKRRNVRLTGEFRVLEARLETENRMLRERLADTQAERDRALEDLSRWRNEAERITGLLEAAEINRALASGTIVPSEPDPVRAAAVDANKGAGATKTVEVGEDATVPAASPWSRFLRWLRGSEPS